MTITRRNLLAGAGAAAGTTVLLPAAVQQLAASAVDPATQARNRLVVLFLFGGNDGLNTVVPMGDLPRDPRLSVYRKVRPAIAFQPHEVRALDRPGDRDEKLGLHPALATVHKLYKQNRVAVVQGVDYPNHNYSHFESADIWHSAEPGRMPTSGWIGRHVDRAGAGEGELRTIAIGRELPLMLRGRKSAGVQITSIEATRFADGSDKEADARHLALALYRSHTRSEPLRVGVGRVCRQTVDMVHDFEKVKQPRQADDGLVNAMLTARALLEQNLGVECVYVGYDGFDTHTMQQELHQSLLRNVDGAIEAFFLGTLRGAKLGNGPLGAALASRTIVMVVSEFGRRIGENGTAADAGTDHGAAAPVLLIGPAGRSPHSGRQLVAGLHGDHPSLGSTTAPADNLMMTTDMRRLYQSVLAHWLQDPDPAFGRGLSPLPGLFA